MHLLWDIYINLSLGLNPTIFNVYPTICTHSFSQISHKFRISKNILVSSQRYPLKLKRSLPKVDWAVDPQAALPALGPWDCSRLEDVSRVRLWWPCKKLERLTWSVCLKTSTCAPSTPSVSPSCQRTSNCPVVFVENELKFLIRHI